MKPKPSFANKSILIPAFAFKIRRYCHIIALSNKYFYELLIRFAFALKLSYLIAAP
jgi:hypothetical protein